MSTLATTLNERFARQIELIENPVGPLLCQVTASDLRSVCTALRDELPFRFEMLVDAVAVDYLGFGQDEWQTQEATASGFSRAVERSPEQLKVPAGKNRFAVIYQLLSLTHNRRLSVKCFCPDDELPRLPSLYGVWPSVNWYEREAFDLFGIVFDDHPDLRRLLTDYGFIGHPFRKDFPLSGEVEVRYDPEQGRVIYQPITIEPRVLVPKVIESDQRYSSRLTNAAVISEAEKKGSGNA